MNYKGLKDVSIYVGGSCNFACSYCDRAYINKVGVQSMDFDPDLVDFIVDIFKTGETPIVSFHGGETLIYIKTIEKIIDGILAQVPNFSSQFFIQTNGSLILKHRDFFEKFKHNLFVSISYDFLYQGVNRTEYDIDSTVNFLQTLDIGIQLQYVIPSNSGNPFEVENFSNIVRLYKKYKITSLDLIVLRHIRHEDRFETVIANEAIDLKQFFKAFIQFVELLYVSGINVVIDGHTSEIDKDYYNQHKQIVLAPNGLIVPEYQFIEYKSYEFALGKWKPPRILIRDESPNSAKKKIRTECTTCSRKNLCGLQYYYAMFDLDPPSPNRCREFYALTELTIKHLFKLKKHRTLLESVGI